jgi:hypothetical protein
VAWDSLFQIRSSIETIMLMLHPYLEFSRKAIAIFEPQIENGVVSFVVVSAAG